MRAAPPDDAARTNELMALSADVLRVLDAPNAPFAQTDRYNLPA